MGAEFDEHKLKWRRKGQRIANMSIEDIKKTLNKRFYALKWDLIDDYESDGEEWEGYSGTLAEKGGANISYFPFLSDNELEKLQNWIARFPRVILGKWDWEGSQSDLVKRFNAWQKKLGKRDKNTLKKLRENGFKLTEQGYALHKISEAKWQDAVGLANNNDVYFFGYCSY